MPTALLAALLLATSAAQEPAAATWRPPRPTVLHEVVQVVDGDTIHVRRDGRVEKLRLLSVDTEEKISGRPALSPSKPETVFGQESALWAREFFDDLARGGRPAQVGLLFPDGKERRDVYGRLLCHVILPDRRDFNLLLVELGKSPYFNKYGNSRVCHEAFVAAQARAREQQLGVWDPATNTPAASDAPAARRPYDRLLPWWQARAEAVENFRRLRARDELRVVAADDPEALELAVERGGRGAVDEVQVFGTIDRFFEEDDGSLTVLFRAGDPKRAFRAVLSPHARRARSGRFEAFLRESTEEFRQNFLFVRGSLERGPRGPTMAADEPEAWRLGGPRPVLPPANG